MKKLIYLAIAFIFIFPIFFGCSGSSHKPDAGKSDLTDVSAAITDETIDAAGNIKTEPSPESSEKTTSDTTGTSETAAEAETIPENSYFVVHYIDVGQGDSELIICDDEAMLIDGGSSDKSDLIYSYLQANNIKHLKYIVATHNDDDHIGGLAGALNYADAEYAYCSSLEYGGSKAFDNFKKYLGDTELTITTAGTEFKLGSAKGTIIAPVETNAGSNNNSIVIRIEYGETYFLFTGDAEEPEENTILQTGVDISSTVLKVGHHGSSTSTSIPFLQAVAPAFAVISCGVDNTYQHPHDKTLRNLYEAGVTLFRTDLQGHIVCYSNGEELYFEVQKNPEVNTYVTFGELHPPAEEMTTADPGRFYIPDEEENPGNLYILNVSPSSHKIHVPWCKSVNKMNEENKLEVYGTSLEDIMARYPDYTPCGNCHAVYNRGEKSY